MALAFNTRGWRRIQCLAESEDPAAGRRRFRLYVIEVEAEWIRRLQANNPAVGYNRSPKWSGRLRRVASCWCVWAGADQ